MIPIEIEQEYINNAHLSDSIDMDIDVLILLTDNPTVLPNMISSKKPNTHRIHKDLMSIIMDSNFEPIDTFEHSNIDNLELKTITSPNEITLMSVNSLEELKHLDNIMEQMDLNNYNTLMRKKNILQWEK